MRIMKKKLIVMLMLVGMAMTAMGQQIAVVFEGGSMRMATTLKQAIDNATDGCVIYLPAGGFQIGDTVRIKHRVSIIGLNHKTKSENADGMTSISGNLFFDEGSDGSVVMGCFISGNVMIGYDEKAVHNIFIRYCNLNAIEVQSNLCTGTTVNQCYIRNTCNFNNAPAIITHNVMNGTNGLNGGLFDHNVVVTGTTNASNSTITYNVFMYNGHGGNNCITYGNLQKGSSWGDACETVSAEWSEVFVDPQYGISSNSDFHFKTEYKKYENERGIYGGKNAENDKYFHGDALPPVPYVKDKKVPEYTNFDGNLVINLTVKDGNK